MILKCEKHSTKIAREKSVQDGSPTDVVRSTAYDTVYVCGWPEGSDSVRILRYSISADKWDVMELTMANTNLSLIIINKLH